MLRVGNWTRIFPHPQHMPRTDQRNTLIDLRFLSWGWALGKAWVIIWGQWKYRQTHEEPCGINKAHLLGALGLRKG